MLNITKVYKGTQVNVLIVNNGGADLQFRRYVDFMWKLINSLPQQSFNFFKWLHGKNTNYSNNNTPHVNTEIG